MERLSEVIQMGTIKIERERCKGCRLCISGCPKGLISLDKSLNKRGVHPAYFKGGECIACALCAQVCPECCIEVFVGLRVCMARVNEGHIRMRIGALLPRFVTRAYLILTWNQEFKEYTPHVRTKAECQMYYTLTM